MPERIILIAEDDEEQVASWKRDITEFNREAKYGFTYVPEFAKSRRAALRALDRFRINCAVVDLRLPDDDGAAARTEPVGNDVLHSVLVETGVPAVVYSGYPQEASEAVQASQIRIIPKKGGGAMEALHWLAGHESLMSAMEIMRKKIAEESAKLFSESIWPRWENSWKDIKDGDALAGVITRQTAFHVAEQLGMPPAYHHPEEFYIVPPLATDQLGTGDLVRIENTVFVVVTPRCNMARDQYPTHIMLALCKTMEGAWAGMRDGFGGNHDKRERAAGTLHSFATQGHSTSTHFLPPCGAEGPWLADFREIMTVSSEKVPELLKTRFASVASQFVPNLVQRCSAYLGRIGQPDLDFDILKAQVCK
jgi:CheY-like chemotaxis protein